MDADVRIGDQAAPRLERLVYEVARGIASETGPGFFHSLVRYLAQALAADFVFAGALMPGANRVVELAAFGETGESRPEEFDLAETPFEELAARDGRAFSFPESAADLFPRDPFLRKVPGDGYVGTPLVDSSGTAVGVMSAITKGRMEHARLAEELLRIFSVRAAAELERTRHSQAIERRNLELRQSIDELTGLKTRLEQDNAYLREEIKASHNIDEMVGISPEFRTLMTRIRRVAPTSGIVLIHGENGAGKELAGRAIHNLSSRRNRLLVTLDCTSVPADSLESELFGTRDAFGSAAGAPRIGRLEYANGGTLLIEEIGALPLDLQAKLLRVIQHQEFRPLGSTHLVKVDVRLLVTTNRDLERSVRDGLFRFDLYDRLLVDPVYVPPLRQRRQDIPLLTEHFLNLHARRLGREDLHPSDRMMREMSAYDWPGNIDELESLLFRAALLRQAVVDMPVRMPQGSSEEPVSLEDAERHHVDRTLVAHNWIIEGPKGAAAALQIPPSTLRSLMKRLGITRAGKAATN